jgi:hypothetical protein
MTGGHADIYTIFNTGSLEVNCIPKRELVKENKMVPQERHMREREMLEKEGRRGISDIKQRDDSQQYRALGGNIRTVGLVSF